MLDLTQVRSMSIVWKYSLVVCCGVSVWLAFLMDVTVCLHLKCDSPKLLSLLILGGFFYG